MVIVVTDKVTPTERKIAEMLLENTGTHMLDSGGAYGRNWERMRDRFGIDRWHPGVIDYDDIARQLKTGMVADVDRYGVLSINPFFFLCEHLDYDERLDRKFQRWCEVTNYGKDRFDKDWGLPLMHRFPEQLRKRAKVGGIYGDGEPVSENSYNTECSLAQTIQIVLFSVENGRDWDGEWVDKPEFLPDDSYVILQIHGGCDVRGGYTDPVLFRMTDEYGILDWSKGYVSCEEHAIVPDGQIAGQVTMEGEILQPKTVQHRWYTDDGYNWYDESWPDSVGDMRFDREEDDTKLHPTWDEDNECWRCPVDGARLVAWA